MLNRNFVVQAFYFLLYLLLQVVFFNKFILFNSAFTWFYVAFLLLIPLETGPIALLFIGFLLGFLVDVFSDTLGMHASACVLIAFIRPFWLQIITPRGGYENISIPTVSAMGGSWFILYALPLLFIHSLMLFLTQAGSMDLFWISLKKAFLSSILSYVVIFISQQLFFGRVRTI